MNWDKSFVNFILVLKIRCWLHSICINNQFDPLFKGDIFCFEYARFSQNHRLSDGLVAMVTYI